MFLSIIGIAAFYHKEIHFMLSNEFKFQFIEQSLNSTKNLPLIFIAIQTFQVVVFIIPGEITQIASGYFLGFWLGLLVTTIGIFFGSSVSFFLSRILGVNFLRTITTSTQFNKFQQFTSSDHSVFSLFLLFLIPGIPKDILCYFAGLSSIRYRTLIILSTVGRLPGIAGSLIIGKAINKEDWKFVFILFVVSILVYICALVYRKKLLKFIGHKHSNIHKLT